VPEGLPGSLRSALADLTNWLNAAQIPSMVIRGAAAAENLRTTHRKARAMPPPRNHPASSCRTGRRTGPALWILNFAIMNLVRARLHHIDVDPI
jgi:hypothetical protein